MALGTSVLILGIGNCLMADDGIGVHAARRLAVLLAEISAYPLTAIREKP